VRQVIGQELHGVSAPPPETEDRQILTRIAAGERLALSELYARHQQLLLRYLLQLTSDHQLAEEIMQDTLVAVWQSARTFGGRSSVRTWLLGIARRQAHNRLRQRRIPLADESELAALVAPDPDPQDAALARAAHEELALALSRLPIILGEVLALVFLHELSYQETAQVLGVPLGTVKSRLNHARRALRALLESRTELER
jgi:RNA polymerase sigma-70 factor (ECF subfamily)